MIGLVRYAALIATAGLIACSVQKNEFDAEDVKLVDTYVRSSLPDNKWGTETRIIVGGWGDVYDGLITFDAKHMPELKSGDKMLILLFNSSSGGKEVPSEMTVAAVMSDFSNGTNYTEAANFRLGATRTVSPSAYGFWTEIDITPEYQAMQTGEEVKGIVLVPLKDRSANQFNSFHSSESSEVQHRPRLRVVRAPN